MKRKGLCSFGSALTVSISWNDHCCSLSCLLLISFCLLSLYAVRSRSLLIYEEPQQLEEPSSPISFADRSDRQTDTSKFPALSLEAVPGTQQDEIMQFTIANETRLEKSVLLGLQQHRWVQGRLPVTRVFCVTLVHAWRTQVRLALALHVLGTMKHEGRVWLLSGEPIGKVTVALENCLHQNCSNTATKLVLLPET